MLEVGFEGCLGARWAGHACSSALSPWAEGLLWLVAGVATSQSGPTPFATASAPQLSTTSATMRQTSRSLRRPWRPLPSPSAAREPRGLGRGRGCGLGLWKLMLTPPPQCF